MNAVNKATQCVILLHGLARTHLSMQAMEKALYKQGYQVINVSYPSRELPVGELAQIAVEQGLNRCQLNSSDAVNFVTHSLGGILLRQYCQTHKIPGLKRVVMLGPPNKGSEAVDKLRDFPGYTLLNGPAGRELGTTQLDLPKKLGPVNFELGVIAGKRSINLLLSQLIPRPNDGKVSVESTQIEGMKDFITLPVTHTFMMRNPQVIQQTLHFLQHGEFDHSKL